jgi:hypothetical protein
MVKRRIPSSCQESNPRTPQSDKIKEEDMEGMQHAWDRHSPDCHSYVTPRNTKQADFKTYMNFLGSLGNKVSA